MDSKPISQSLDFHNYFRFSDPLANRPLRLRAKPESDHYSTDYFFSLAKGKVTPKEPIKFYSTMGGQSTEILWAEIPVILCISTKVVDLLRENQITGWGTYPVEVYGRKGEFLPGYHGFSVTGRECKRDKSRSQIITKQVVPNGKPFQAYVGLYFIESDWDGNDFFIVSSFGGTVVTKKVRDLFKKEKITNIRFTNLLEVELDMFLDRFDK
jgi:hypothetical protein